MIIVNSNSRLPSQYQEVEWIISSSNSAEYILTDFVPTLETEVRAKYFYATTSASLTDIVSSGNATNNGVNITYWISGPSVACSFGGKGYIPTASAQLITSGKRFEVVLNKTSVTVNGTSYNLGATSSPVQNQLRVFGSIWSTATYSPVSLISLEIYDNGQIQRNYVPCYRKSDDVIGLYDAVTNSFITNTVPSSLGKGENVYSEQKEYKRYIDATYTSYKRYLNDMVIYG